MLQYFLYFQISPHQRSSLKSSQSDFFYNLQTSIFSIIFRNFSNVRTAMPPPGIENGGLYHIRDLFSLGKILESLPRLIKETAQI